MILDCRFLKKAPQKLLIAWFVLIINPRRMLAFAALVPSSSREQRDRRILRGAQTRRGAAPTTTRVYGKVTFLLKGELHPSAELTSKLVSSMPPSSAEEGLGWCDISPPRRHPRGSKATEGSCAAHKLVGGHSVHPRLWESNFAFGKSQRLLRRSLRAKALGFVRSALLHYQNFVSGVALAQDDISERYLR